MMDSVWRDLRYAWRHARSSSGFTSAVIITLALGLGAAGTLFSLTNALYRPLDIPESDRLVALSRSDARGLEMPFPLQAVGNLSSRQDVLQSPVAYSGGPIFTIDVGGAPSAAAFAFVSDGYYALLGARPQLGRLLTAGEAPLSGEAAPVAVLSHRFWQRQFAGDPTVVGRAIRVESVTVTIVGVTPPGVQGLHLEFIPDLTVPIGLLPTIMSRKEAPGRTAQVNSVLARLPEGLTIEEARARIEVVWPAIEAETPLPPTPGLSGPFRARLQAIPAGFSSLRDPFARPLFMLLALAGVLLAVACVNVAGLLMARSEAQRQAIEVRIALGASRFRIAQHLLIDSVMLASLGALLSVPIVWWGTSALNSLLRSAFSSPSPPTISTSPDLRVVLALAVLTVICGVGVGVLPGIRAAEVGSAPLRHGRSVVRRAGCLGNVSIIGQVALALLLVFGAGLLSRSLVNLRTVDQGFTHDRLWWARLTSQPGGYNSIKEAEYYPELVRRLEGLPGVQSVALSRFFLTGVEPRLLSRPVVRADRPDQEAAQTAFVDAVSPRYFETVGTSRLSGRDFTWADGARSAPVAIVNRMLAERLFPGNDAVGQFIRVGPGTASQAVEVVGVVANSTLGNARSEHGPIVYRPTLQGDSPRAPSVMVRTAMAPEAVVESARRVIESFGYEYPLFSRPVTERLDSFFLNERLAAAVAWCFGTAAAAIAAVGVCGLLGYAVERRRREIGVRLALGASRRAVVGLLLSQGARLVVIGIAGGFVLTLLAGRWLRALLFGLSPFDLPTLTATGLSLFVVGALAALLPAVRASRLDPMKAIGPE